MKIFKFKSNFIKPNFIAIGLGIIVGFSLGIIFKLTSNSNSAAALWFKLPGILFIRMKQLLILPIIFFGIIASTSSLDIKKNAGMSIAALLITLLCITVASIVGLVGSFSFSILIDKPNENSNVNHQKQINTDRSIYDIFSDFSRNIIADNILKAGLYTELTQYTISNKMKNEKTSNETILVKNKDILNLFNPNLIGILIIAYIIGIAASSLQERGEIFRSLIQSINEIFFKILHKTSKLAPFGIGSLIFAAVIDISDLDKTFKQLWIFVAITISCSLFYTFCFQSLLVFLITRTNPFSYFPKFIELIMLAFASSSSAVCISKGMYICEQKIHIAQSISRFAVPLFTTIKPDGSALFVTLATVFLAKINNYSVGFSEYGLIFVLTCTNALSLPPSK